MQELFNTDVQIPSLPDIYYKFKEAMDDPEGSFDEISDIIYRSRAYRKAIANRQ